MLKFLQPLGWRVANVSSQRCLDCLRHSPAIPHRHEMPIGAIAYQLCRSSRTICSNDRAITCHGLDDHIWAGFVQGRKRKQSRAAHVGEWILLKARKTGVFLQAELPRQVLQLFSLRSFTQDEQPQRDVLPRQGAGFNQRRKILHRLQPAHAQHHRRLPIDKPGMVDGLSGILKQRWGDSRVVDDPNFFQWYLQEI